MSVTGFAGPLIGYGITLSSTSGDGITGADFEHNPNRAPSLSDLGSGMLDPRAAYDYKPAHANTTVGFYNNLGLVDYVPLTANTSAFVAATVSSSGVSTFTVTASSANGTFSTTILAPETGQNVTVIAIESTAAQLKFGSGAVQMWNPGFGAGRNITIKPSSNLDGGTFTVAGRDVYGYKMTEQIAGGSTNLAGKKAFKYITSITNTTTPTSTSVAIGYGDVFGLPFYGPYAGLNIQIGINSSFSNSALVPLSTTNFVAASTAATQTSTTPDVRGTFSSTTASNGVQRLQITVTPPTSGLIAITSTNVAPIFGATQFSSV
jgi:hypothetical protein